MNTKPLILILAMLLLVSMANAQVYWNAKNYTNQSDINKKINFSSSTAWVDLDSNLTKMGYIPITKYDNEGDGGCIISDVATISVVASDWEGTQLKSSGSGNAGCNPVSTEINITAEFFMVRSEEH